ncbi:2-oxo-4-hydroxy-4-carboxy-5-ureidoimidazoline decarboxylase [Alphaproteobacteria bacterium]|nr:2-oxo-4-hydroxy-4-carboxy-5-ureidoimidazoline decarboxylase [Alphaproteobacteria bacterium]
MSNKTFIFLSKKISKTKIIELLKSIYEHSPWVPERLFSNDVNEILNKEYLQQKMKSIVDNASKKEKLDLIKSHPELGNKLKKIDELTEFSKKEQKSAGLDQCNEEEFEVLTQLNKQYRNEFQFPFIIAVKGLSKNDIINEMKKRVHNSEEEEFETAMKQIHKIASLRIKDLTF